MKTILPSFFFLLFASVSMAQTYDVQALLQSNKLTVVNRTVTPVTDGKFKGVKFNESSGQGLAWLTDVSFSTGTIELDIRGQDVLQRSFVGVAFHGTNNETYDVIYFRPFNFKAQDPVRKIHAVQYVSHPTYTWNKLREEKNGIYEKGLINPPDPNGWFHARIVVTEKEVKVFVNDDKEPSLTVTKISDIHDGKIGLWVGESSGGEFANFSIKK
jgi:hypothetical protein